MNAPLESATRLDFHRPAYAVHPAGHGRLDSPHFEIKHATPAWFILVAGNILVPDGGRALSSVWAYSFPLAALPLATLEMGARTGLAFYAWLGWGLLTALTLVIAGLT